MTSTNEPLATVDPDLLASCLPLPPVERNLAVPEPGTAITQWGLDIAAPLTLDDPDHHDWKGSADVIVVGLGGAGVAAALQSLENGLSVTAFDHYSGGGSSAANGGVYYAGGGTSIQREAGVEDSPEKMFTYLKTEVGDLLSDDAIRDFCETSAPTLEWLRSHGGPFKGTLYAKKTSYPPLDKFLYHPDSTLARPFRDLTRPVARGHRVAITNGRKAWGLGKGLWEPLKRACLERGMEFHSSAEARQLAVDATGRVIGVRVQYFPDPAMRARHAALVEKANKWMGVLPPTFPGARFTIGRGTAALIKARTLEAQHRKSAWFRARKGVVLSAGGFICNPEMVAHYAPDYAKGLPNGNLGDDGSGIMLGVSVGGKTALMNRVSAWRFLSPPKAWGQGMLVNGQGARFTNETWYGARIGDAMVERNGGRGYIILDRALYRQSLRDAFADDVLPFQRDITLVNAFAAAVKADTPEALAAKLGFDPAVFGQNLADYNAAAKGQQEDAFYKTPDEMAVLNTGPYYAIDASVDAKMFPIACMTVGGLTVDEKTGGVERVDGAGTIAGLYAAGRNAVGICSNLYVSGLSYADCIWSGRRAANAIAQQG